MAERMPKLLRRNHKRLIWRIRINGPTSRARLAADLELSNSVVTDIARELLAFGLIEEQPAPTGDRGRPVVPLGLFGKGAYAAGATIHPGWVEFTIVDFAGGTMVHETASLDDINPRGFAEHVEARLSQAVRDHRLLHSRFLGLGIAIPGYVMADDPETRWTVEWLNSWRGIQLGPFFDDFFGFPVWIEKESIAAAIAEYYQDDVIAFHRSILVFFLGHGVGGGVVTNRTIYRGDNGNAGEIGRLYLQPTDRPSGIDLLQTLQAAGVEATSLTDLDRYVVSHRALFEAWMDRAASQLAIALTSGVAWNDPGAVVFSGALPRMVLEGLAARLQGWDLEPHRSRPPALLVSWLGSRAAALGAALLPIHATIALADDD